MSRPANSNLLDDRPADTGAATTLDVNPCAFIVGCPRSGTTLLQRMLDCHPWLTVANDTHFIPRALENTSKSLVAEALLRQPIPLTRELAEAVRRYHRFANLGVDDFAVGRAIECAATYAEFVQALYGELAHSRGKRLAAEKTPDYVRRIPLLDGLFPHVRFVHIIRDGRDVTLSLLEWANEIKGPGRLDYWRQEPVGVSALWWRWLVSSGRAAGASIGPVRYHEVIYETLVDQPENQLRAISAFLDIPMASEMLAYYEGKIRPQQGLSAKQAWLPPTAGLRNWRTEMPSADVELFETLAGDLLSTLGYERAAKTGSQTIHKRAEHCLDWWKCNGPGRSAGASNAGR